MRRLIPCLLGSVLFGATPAAATVISGPVFNPANGHSYVLLAQSCWTAAEAEAITLGPPGTHLVTINDQAENVFVFNTFGPLHPGDDLWIGFNDVAVEGVFEWVSGEPITFTNWACCIGGGPEPNNLFGDDYGVIWRFGAGLGGEWADLTNCAAFVPNSTPYGVVEIVPEPATLDIKPESCPNPVNCRSNGRIPVALLGSLNFDVKQVDLDSLQLCLKDGVGGCCTPERVRFEDVATPFPGDPQDPDDCCHDLGGDGIQDLVMHFRTRQCCENLGLTEDSFLSLELNGLLLDGTPFSADDCIRVVREGDLDGDGLVGIPDLLRLLGEWGLCGPMAQCSADYNGDDMVGIVDLLIMLANWG